MPRKKAVVLLSVDLHILLVSSFDIEFIWALDICSDINALPDKIK